MADELQIESPIIIDPREAFLQNQGSISEGQHWTPSIGLRAFEKPDEREWCEPANSASRTCGRPSCKLCCDKWDLRYTTYEDFGVEEIRARDFIKNKPLLSEKTGVEKLLDEDQERDIMTLPPRLYAFALRNRKWSMAVSSPDVIGNAEPQTDCS